jgi:hypothetical protein
VPPPPPLPPQPFLYRVPAGKTLQRFRLRSGPATRSAILFLEFRSRNLKPKPQTLSPKNFRRLRRSEQGLALTPILEGERGSSASGSAFASVSAPTRSAILFLEFRSRNLKPKPQTLSPKNFRRLRRSEQGLALTPILEGERGSSASGSAFASVSAP